MIQRHGMDEKIAFEFEDMEHYRRHPKCDRLWCVVYDPLHLIRNPSGLVADLEGPRATPDGLLQARVFVVSGS